MSFGGVGSDQGGASSARREWLAYCALLVLATGWAGYGLYSDRRSIEAQERGRLEQQVDNVEQRLVARLQSTSNALESLRADLPELMAREDALARINERLRVMVSVMAGVRTFLWVNRAGVVLASNRKELIGGDWHKAERYRTISTNPDASLLYVSPPFLTPLGNWALSLGRAILDAKGGFDGYLLAIVDPDYFNLLLAATRYAPDMSCALIHGEGTVIYRIPDPTNSLGMNLAAIPASILSRHLASGRQGGSYIGVLATTGREALVVLRNVRPSSSPADRFLVVSLARETAAVFAPWWVELTDRVALLAVLAAASALGVYFNQRRRAANLKLRAEQEAERQRQDEARASLQAQLAQAQKLESVGRLAGGIAHDFNNLLTVILSFGDEARQEVRKGQTPDPGFLDEVMAASERAAELTKQLLAFARKQSIAPVTLDVNEQLRSSEKLLRRVIGEDVAFDERLQDGLWPVRCDPGLLGQVVLNLAVNARDAMPDGGTITLTTQNVSVSGEDPAPAPEMPPGDYVRLAVKDTGTGMSPAVMEHLFEPFFTTKGAGKGTGLGLSTVYGIVKQSGAHIGVRSSAGRGTTFEIFFPRELGAQEATAQAPRLATGGNETILVVEDDPSVRGAVVRALGTCGYRVLTASGASEAVALARANGGALHLLLTDVVLPGHGGHEVARLVVQESPGVRVLYMSGYTQEAISRQGVRDEGGDFVPKPFTADTLRERVRAVLDRSPGPPAPAQDGPA